MLTDKDREALENVLENGRVDDVLFVILATKCAKAYDKGVMDMSRALQGGNEPVNPYRLQ